MEQKGNIQGTIHAANGQAYDYFAFISYSRKDEPWAKQLQKKMEQYRLPAILRKEESTLPKKIRPIFRDKTDLTTGQLQSALHKELDSSKKLIVICSPSSARSEWVNKEVQRFIDLGRADDIIPFIVDGIPNSGDETECFPKALQLPEEDQILGVSVPELGKGDAFLRVVAGLLEIKFDQLKRRHEQRRRRNNLITAACTLLFLAVAGFAGFKAWDYYVPHEKYYTDYVLRWGVPEGITELTKQEITSREGHYVIVSERGLVRKLIYANSVGTPMKNLEVEVVDHPMISLYYYTDDGQISHVEYVDNNGRVLSTQVYTTDLAAVDLQISKSNSSLQTLSASTTSTETGMYNLMLVGSDISGKSDIARYLLEYNEDGYVTKRIYMRDRRTPILDADGIGGLEYVLDSLGRPTEIRYLGLNGEGYTTTKRNVAGKSYSYDDVGNLLSVKYLDPQGAPCLNENGWMICEYGYDENGNNILRTYLDASGEIAPSSLGYAYAVFSYDERGNYISAEYFAVSGERATHKNGSAIVRKEYDSNGRFIRQSYFDRDEKPAITPYGISVEIIEYDERGNQSSVAFLGTDGEPIVGGEGYASMKSTHDERGNRTSESYFGVDGEPVLNQNGIAAFFAEYDDQNNNISRKYYGTDGNLTLFEKSFAIQESEFDDRGNDVRDSYFGTDGKPILREEGYSIVVYTFDDGGNLVAHHYFGVDGQPVLCNAGYASLEVEFDDRGNLASIMYFGLSGEPVMNTYGYAKSEHIRNERGDETYVAVFDVDNKPVLTPMLLDSAAMSIEYDERGNVIASTFLGEDGKPKLNNDGFARMEFKSNEYGVVFSISHFDVDGMPINCNEGYTLSEVLFNEYGDMVDVVYHNVEGDELFTQVIMITDASVDSRVEALGLKDGDVIVQYGDWNYFEMNPNNYSVMSIAPLINSDLGEYVTHSPIFYFFILGLFNMDVGPHTLTIYRPSTGELIDFELGESYNFEFNDYYVTEEAYQALSTAWSQATGG